MSVAVLTLTRDRLDYTKHCFLRLRENAGVPFDHYVLDQGSGDGTWEWLCEREKIAELLTERVNENIGISRGMNRLLALASAVEPYDWYVKFDNDCELTQPNSLKRCIDIGAHDWILSPRVMGLREPPGISHELQLGAERVGKLGQLGGIFMLIPGWVINEAGFRYNEENPVWGWDDVQLSIWMHDHQGHVGYLLDLTLNHYETTDGQWERYPEYFNRKIERDGMPGHVVQAH